MNAQNVYAQVSAKQIQVGEILEYSVVADVSINQITPPSFDGFQVLGQPSQGQTTQFVNGQASMQLSVTWQLMAQKEGKYTLGKAIVTGGNQRYETKPITVEVFKGASSQGKNAASDVFIRTTVSKSKCFLGEEVLIIQKVYTQQQLVGLQEFTQPAYDGFYSVAQETKSKGQMSVENIDGINYYTYELFRTIGIANKVGKAQINPVKGVAVVRRAAANKARNIFEQFFGAPAYEDIPIEIKSKLVTVEVSDLPESGKPEDFNGAVGDYAYKVAISRSEVKAHDAFNLKLTVTGTGNLKLLLPPKFKLPDDFEMYDPKVSESENSKTFDYLVIPRIEGTYNLGPINFSYFSSTTKKYVTLSSSEMPLKVLPGDPGAAKVYQPRNDIKQSENDIRYIKKDVSVFKKENNEFFNSGLHISLLILPLVLFGLGLWFRNRQILLNKDVVAVRKRRASKMAAKHLSQASKIVATGNKEAFYTAILSALYDYLSFKLNISRAEINREKIQHLLSQNQVDSELLSKLLKVLEDCEFVKYAPGAVSGDLNAVFQQTAQIITQLEEALNKQ